MSFLMITYNQEKTIEQALKSALAQDYPNMERRLSGAVLIRKNEAARPVGKTCEWEQFLF